MSSEALERARLAIKRAMECPDYHAGYAQELQREGRVALDALLAEVARLEQELERTQLDAALGRAALAVAREREQRAVDALRREIRHRLAEHEGWAGDLDDAVEAALRAALVDEPAAAAGRSHQALGRCRCGANHTLEEAIALNGGPGSASAAADEPGETPA